jgi:hypothetical protein
MVEILVFYQMFVIASSAPVLKPQREVSEANKNNFRLRATL